MKNLRVLLFLFVAFVINGWASQAQVNFILVGTPAEYVYRENLENGNVLLPIQWTTNFELTETMHITISQITADNELIDIQIPYTNQWQTQTGLNYVAPVNFSELDRILLWVRVLDGDNIIVTGNTFLEIIDDPAPDLPETTISRFDVTNVQWDENNQLIAEVAWQVEDRPDATNFVFEQILADDMVMNIEQAREDLLIDLEGNGFGVLQAPTDPAEPIQLRLRLFDLQTGRVINQIEVSTAYPTDQTPPQATAVPTNPPAPSSTIGASIISFTITPDPVERGGEITLNWETQGMISLSITRLSEVGQIFIESIADNLADSGSVTYQLPEEYVSQAEFILLGTDANDSRYQSTVTVDIICQFTPIYATNIFIDCPVNQQTVQIATQAFESGLMVWRADTRQIYTLFTGGSYLVFPDTWTTDIVYELPSEPPANLIAPLRGFGYVWATNDVVRNGLGWATAQEQSATVTLETYIIPARFVDVIVFELPNGQVVQIGSAIGTWRYLE